MLAQVVGLVDRVELDRRVEVREDDDQHRLERRGTARIAGWKCWLMKLCVFGKNWPIVGGNAITAAAKMIGMTPAMFTRSGR